MLALATFFKNVIHNYILLLVKQRKRYRMFLLVFQPNQSEFAASGTPYVNTAHHPTKQHVHIHEHLRDNLINGKIYCTSSC